MNITETYAKLIETCNLQSEKLHMKKHLYLKDGPSGSNLDYNCMH